jgi:hypothetical protein
MEDIETRCLALFFEGRSECLSPREQTAVHSVNDGLRTDLPTAKVSSVQSLDGVLASADPVELEVDVALSVGVEGDVHDMAVFFFAFGADIVFEFFDPDLTFFSVVIVSNALT